MSRARVRRGDITQHDKPEWQPLLDLVGERVTGDFMPTAQQIAASWAAVAKPDGGDDPDGADMARPAPDWRW